jgi:Tol biopolymer transport system component
MPTRGHWLWAAASPDGKTILADWTSECDVPKTYLIDARGGTPRPATQGGSEAFGWTTDGHAIVANRVDPGCVEGGEPGLALVTPDGEAKQLGKAVPRDLQRTIAARDESEITAP